MNLLLLLCSPRSSKLQPVCSITQIAAFRQAKCLAGLAFHNNAARKNSLSVRAFFLFARNGIINSKSVKTEDTARKEMSKIESDRIFPAEARQILQPLLIYPRYSVIILVIGVPDQYIIQDQNEEDQMSQDSKELVL